jgi:hypothetical protein
MALALEETLSCSSSLSLGLVLLSLNPLNFFFVCPETAAGWQLACLRLAVWQRTPPAEHDTFGTGLSSFGKL